MTNPGPGLAALVRQHALTAQLLGVDCVPMYVRARSASPAAEATRASIAEAEAPGSSAAPVDDGPALFGGSAEPTKEPSPAPVRAVASAEANTTMSSAAARLANVPGSSASARPASPKPTDREQSQRRLDELRARYEREAPHKEFVTAYTNIVWGEGDPCARLMFVGEAPGEEEDRTGRPFVGRSGELLTRQIIAMGFTRESVYIANILKTRPPNNATPTARECALCKPYLLEQIEIVRPEVIITLGNPATHTLLETTEAMARLHGKWARLVLPSGLEVAVLPTYHPSYLLRNYTDEARKIVWADLLVAVARLGSTPTTRSAKSDAPR